MEVSEEDRDQTELPAGLNLKLPEIKRGKGSKQHGGWSSGLFGCMKSPCNACCVSTMISLGSVGLWFAGLPCGTVKLLSSYRAKLRKQFNIAESPAQDWAIHSFCCCCGLCQEYRELKHRGFDPSLGWKRNIEKMEKNKNIRQQQTVKPPPNQRMDRS